MKQKKIIIILAVLVVIFTAFIFSNSLKSPEESKQDSDFVVNIVEPAIEKVFGHAPQNLSLIIRKLAHMTEFCVLSVLVALLVSKIYKYMDKSLFGYGFFYVLAVAVSDEFIQYFSGRGSSVVDVVIDFSGATIGFLTVYSIVYFIPSITAKMRKAK